MAHSVLRYKVMDGDSHVTLHVRLNSDGQSGDLVNYVLLDPTQDLVPKMPRRQDFILKQIWFELVGVTATLGFNSIVPWQFWTLGPGASLHHDWRFFGGIRDNSAMPLLRNINEPNAIPDTMMEEHLPLLNTGGLDSDGRLLLSTTNFTPVTSQGTFVLWLEKRNRPNPQAA